MYRLWERQINSYPSRIWLISAFYMEKFCTQSILPVELTSILSILVINSAINEIIINEKLISLCINWKVKREKSNSGHTQDRYCMLQVSKIMPFSP